MLTVENIIDPAWFRIERANAHLHESRSTDDLPEKTPPVNIIQDDQTLYVHFVWRQDGHLAEIFDRDCRWECRAYIERMGQFEAPDPAPDMVSFRRGKGVTNHGVVVISGLPEGAYKIVATLLFRGPGNSATPLAAYEEIGILQVYRDN